MERHFPIKSGQPRGMAFTIFIPFPNSLHDGLSKLNGTANIGATGSTDQRCGPEYSSLTEPKRTFPFDFRPKLPKSLA